MSSTKYIPLNDTATPIFLPYDSLVSPNPKFTK